MSNKVTATEYYRLSNNKVVCHTDDIRWFWKLISARTLRTEVAHRHLQTYELGKLNYRVQ